MVIVESMVLNSDYRIYQIRGNAAQRDPCSVFNHESCKDLTARVVYDCRKAAMRFYVNILHARSVLEVPCQDPREHPDAYEDEKENDNADNLERTSLIRMHDD